METTIESGSPGTYYDAPISTAYQAFVLEISSYEATPYNN
jgi:hypothetical protein